MPDEEINVSDKEIYYALTNKKAKLPDNIFPSGMPKMEDIKQGYTDLDCYFLSVVAGVAKKNPKDILKCFPEYPQNPTEENIRAFNAKKKVKIRFYKVKENLINDKIVCQQNGIINITVDKTAMRSKGAPWVRILEKAYAIYRAKGYDIASHVQQTHPTKKINSRIIDGTNGGNSKPIITTLTGKNAECYINIDNNDRKSAKKFSGSYSAEANNLFNKIKSAINQKKVITALANKGDSTLYKKGLFLRHEYTILDVKEENGFKFVIIRNPYANRSRKYVQDNKGKYHSKSYVPKDKNQRGISELELNNFHKYFSSIDFES